jgi:tRNA G18 (ribose-2'-O)-methylase SpoU
VYVRVESIDDAADPRLGDYHDLRGAARDVFVVEGRLLVRKLLASRFRLRSILTTDAALADIEAVLVQHGGETCAYLATVDTVQRLVGFPFHRGCLAAAERGTPLALADLIPDARLLVVLEHVTNPDNIGGVFRNAAAFGADGVVLSPGCGDPLYPKATRVAMGGSLEVPFALATDWPAALAHLKDAGFTLVALTPDARAVELDDLRLPERVALLLGTEGDGITPGTRAAADVVATIGMVRGADSLNVATASGIVLHRWRARLGQPTRVVP